MKINMDREVWEGWTVRDFIDYMEPLMDEIMLGRSLHKPFVTKTQMAMFVTSNQSGYKKKIPEVIEYFAERYCLQ